MADEAPSTRAERTETTDHATSLADAVRSYQAGRFNEAEDLCRAVLGADPRCADAHHLIGVLKARRGQPSEALPHFDEALSLAPNKAAALANRGAALSALHRFAEALEAYDRLLEQRPSLLDAARGRAGALYQLGRFDEAREACVRTLALQANDVSALIQHGSCLLALKRPKEALESYDHALTLAPSNVSTLINRGSALRDLKQHDAALESYDRALALAPMNLGALYNRAQLLLELARTEEAEACYARLVALAPQHGEGHYGRANALVLLGRLAEALETYTVALAVTPSRDFLYGSWLHTKMRLCDWRDLDRAFVTLAEKLAQGAPAASPFPALATPVGRALQRKAAEAFVRKQGFAAGSAALAPSPATNSRIRLGYFSADFRNHPVSYLTHGLYEHHNRARFELHAFSFGPPGRDEMRARLEPLFDEFHDVRAMSVDEITRLARARGLDIAVDLGGFTRESRPEIFAARAAPVQINYLGYPGTSGADYIDYLIGDGVLIPEGQLDGYSEKIAYLPYTFQANASYRALGAVPGRSELGLPRSAVVFASFNNSYKLNPLVFDRWLSLLKRIPESVLWLLEDNPWQRQNLSNWATGQGVSGGRLLYAPNVSYAEHLTRYQAADLALDCWPFNGGTTTSDALRAGVPVVTLLGDTFAGRMTASVLGAVGLTELVTHSAPAYEELAFALATDPLRRADLRQRLAKNRLTHPLFDSRLFTRYLEAAYTRMVDRCRARLPPDHIYISP